MTRGIQLKALSANDLHSLGLPLDTLAGALDRISEEIGSDDEAAGSGQVSALAVTRDVRRTLEEVLDLLTEALPA
jgi:hypothetical protein